MYNTPSSKRKIEDLERDLNLCDKCNEKLSNDLQSNKLPYLVDESCGHIICQQCNESALSSAQNLCPVNDCLSSILSSRRIFLDVVQRDTVEELRKAQKSELDSLSEKQDRAKTLLGCQWMGPKTIEEELQFVTHISSITSNNAGTNNETTRSTCMAVDNSMGGYVVGVAYSTMNSTGTYCGEIGIYENGQFKQSIRTKNEDILLDIQFKPSDNRVLAVGSKDSCFYMYDRRQSDVVFSRKLNPAAPIGSVCWDTNCSDIFLCAQNFGNVVLFDIRNSGKPLAKNDELPHASLNKSRAQNPNFFKFVKVNCFWGLGEAEFYANEHTPTYVLSNEFGVSLFSKNPREPTHLALFKDCTISRKSSIIGNFKGDEPAPGPISCTAFDVNTKSLALFERVYPYHLLFKEASVTAYHKREQQRELNFLQYPSWNSDMLQQLSADEKHLWIPKSRFCLSYTRERIDSKTFDQNFITHNSWFKEIDFVRHHSLETSSLCLTLTNQSFLTVFDIGSKQALGHLDLAEIPNLPPVTGVTGFYDKTNNSSMIFVHHTSGFYSFLLKKIV
jgi:WD40 repeat protein